MPQLSSFACGGLFIYLFIYLFILTNFSLWLCSLVTSWWWYKTLRTIGHGFDSHKGVFPCLLGFLLNWCGVMPSGDGYDRVVLVAR
ncbi:hypothetical protein Hanom_Chr08g00741701 [Helianthus anomalus]